MSITIDGVGTKKPTPQWKRYQVYTSAGELHNLLEDLATQKGKLDAE